MFRKILGLAASAMMFGFIACSDNNPSGGFDAPPVAGESSSSVVSPSSSDVGGSAANVSSSSVAESSNDNAACLWNGQKGEYIVNTGFDPEGVHGAGYWYTYDDNDDGGVSRVEWDAECPNDGTDCMQYIVEHCNGLCGKMYVKRGNAKEAVVGVAFNVAGYEDPAADMTTPLSADISDWGGICVTFSSDLNLFMSLSVDSKTEVSVELGQSEKLVEKCFTWADFDKDDEGDNPMPAAEAAKKVQSITFGKRSGESMIGPFTIASIGKYVAGGACGTGLVNTNHCTDMEQVSEMWNWMSGITKSEWRVITGMDNGTGTSGFWFSFGDDMAGVGSVNRPHTLDHLYTADGDEIYDHCNGVCGELEFAKEGYLGVGFHVVGVVNPADDNSPGAKANISSWGGLCVTYASESDLEVVLTYAQTSGFGDFSRMPKTTLPKSIELKTVCLDWKNYFMSVFSEVSTTHMTSILFAVQGNANTKSRINIRGLGKYSEASNFCSLGEDEFVSGKKGLVIR